MWTTLHLHVLATNSEQMSIASTLLAKAATMAVDQSGVDVTLTVNHFNPDAPEEPDWEKMYIELASSIDKLATEWDESGTQYKMRLAEELRFRTGVAR